jgi:hypothetical protein
MANTSTEARPRTFNPNLAGEHSDEARKAVNAAFEAMSTWRAETLCNSEKSSGGVIDKMPAAARALGWPEQIVDATRTQLQSITGLQIQMMDQMMDVWEEEIKSPSSAILSKLKSLSNIGPAGSWPTAASEMTALNPFQIYMHFAEQWQKAWTEATAFWSKPGLRPRSLT